MFGFRSVTLPTTTFARVVIGLTLFSLVSFRAGAVPPDPSLYFPGQLLVKLKPAPSGLAPQAVPSQYKKAVYLGGALEPATDKALHDGTANVVIADHPVSMGWIGVSEAVSKLNGVVPPKMVCLPNSAITPDMLGTPIAKLQQSAAGLG